LIVFFDIRGIVMAERVRSGQTVNQQYYIEILTKLLESVKRKRQELWRNGWIFEKEQRASPQRNVCEAIFS